MVCFSFVGRAQGRPIHLRSPHVQVHGASIFESRPMIFLGPSMARWGKFGPVLQTTLASDAGAAAMSSARCEEEKSACGDPGIGGG